MRAPSPPHVGTPIMIQHWRLLTFIHWRGPGRPPASVLAPRPRGSRRWPGPSGARCDAEVELGRPYDEAELGPLDHFLTARFRLYSTLAGRLVVADAEHPPWPLFSARLHELRQDLVQAAGLPA